MIMTLSKGMVVGMLLILYSSISPAQNKKEKTSFTVYGNCEMCKNRIEAALDVKGVAVAAWDEHTKLLTVIYRPSQISLDQIHEHIAHAGHDTDLKKASEEAYTKLPDCCRYRENPDIHSH